MAAGLLILSPHLDDGVLSCPLRITRAVAAGQSVTVATFFTEGRESSRARYLLRKREDERALGLLNAGFHHFGLLDAPERSDIYRTFSGIVFEEDPTYPSTVCSVAERLRAWVEEHQPAEVIAPLAIGGHVDHRIVREAAIRTLGADPRLSFYEDRPYALIPGIVDRALRAGQTDNGLAADDLSLSRLRQEFLSARYVRTYLGRQERDELIRRMDWLDPLLVHLELRPRSSFTQASKMELDLICQAVYAYESQWLDLFDGRDEVVRTYGSVPETCYAMGSAVRPNSFTESGEDI